jgi:hypothetical protein
MTRKTRAYLYVIALPFVISASFEFLDAWLYWPIALICGMAWVGACSILAEKENP